MKRKMTSRERVLTAFARREPDRVPINYSANAGIDRRLKEHFKLKAEDDEGLRQALGVDFRCVYSNYKGPRLHPEVPGRQVHGEWGWHLRWIEHETGGYWDYCDFPLKGADEERVRAWPMPSPDDYDVSGVPEICGHFEGYALWVGGAGGGDIINTTGFLCGMEQVLVDLITDNPATLMMIDRRLAIQLEVTRRVIEAAKGKISFMWMGEDLGSQQAPLISLELYRRHLRPRHQKFVDLAKAYGLPVMIHTCGSSSWAYADFIEMGINVVDTLQPEAANMSPAYLKRRYGHGLAFHGCISTAGPVAFGTVPDVVRDVRQTLEIMMPGGGYCLAPTHCLQDNSPTANVLAMYATAHKFGQYA